MLNYVAENAKQYTATYGNITAQSVGAIQRALLTLENQGADKFFAEPSFDIYDLLQCEQGKGVMNVLAADKLMLNPKLYSTYLLWLLSELYAQLPEVGDMELPKLVFFFDEAHMLFDETSKALVDKIEQVVRLIRSKGVGVYFVTQSPTDIPEEILGQLGNRVQHALRAFTPKDQKAVKSTAETFRANPSFDTEEAILELGTGEALVSFIDETGKPSIVERATILPPQSMMAEISKEEICNIVKNGMMETKYRRVLDRDSAFEKLEVINDEKRKKEEEEQKKIEEEKEKKRLKKEAKENETVISKSIKKVTNSALSTIGRKIGDAIARGIFGTRKR